MGLLQLLIIALESFGGQRLLQKGDINIGAHANTMFRIKVCEEPSIDLHKSKDNRHTTYLGMFTASLSRGFNIFIPIYCSCLVLTL